MDILTIVLLAVVVLLILALVLVLTRRGGDEAETMRQQLALALSQQAETVQRVERSLREQEQALSKVVGERLDRTEKATGQIVTDLRERLVRIDEAQKKIGDLSTQVVSLQEVLSNKQARGAFGEVQLNDLVQNALPPQAYEFQSTLSSGARVDCLLHLPNPPGSIGIDAGDYQVSLYSKNITDNTTISTATPRASPMTDIDATNDTKPRRCVERR